MDDPASYEIRVAEHLDERWAGWFDGLEILHIKSGETILRGELADQSALFGTLIKMRDLGLMLISVRRLSPLKPQVKKGNVSS